MDLILSNAADILLILATLGAGTFCLILSRRHPPEDEKDDAIPLFLQKKSRLAEIG